MLDAGDYIPADGRLLESASLKVDESALTGESLGVEKMTDAIEGEVPLGDRTNMVYSGSFVTYGRGSFIVTGIGMETEVGKIASLLKTTSEKENTTAGESGPVWTEAFHHYSDFLRYFYLESMYSAAAISVMPSCLRLHLQLQRFLRHSVPS